MYLIFHPKRETYYDNSLIIHHDKFGDKNEDPYIWNTNFLHTYCHITQMSPKIGDINFWVSAENFRNFSSLYCDCVFVVEKKEYWSSANSILINDPIVDNRQSFQHHYQWGNTQHQFKTRKRFTLKANAESSFQPQNLDGTLIDIVPFLNGIGVTLNELQKGMKAGFQSKPMKLDDSIAKQLYTYLVANSRIKLFGNQIMNLHP